MHPMIGARLVLIAALVLGGLMLLEGAARKPRPPQASAVAGAWMGYAEGEVEFLRLELDRSGKGYLAVSYSSENPPRVYGVEKWRVDELKVDVDVYPKETDAEPIALQKLDYRGASLTGELSGRGWSRTVTLFNEQSFLARNQALKDRIDKQRNTRPY
jgi:hypothetical protein